MGTGSIAGQGNKISQPKNQKKKKKKRKQQQQQQQYRNKFNKDLNAPYQKIF